MKIAYLTAGNVGGGHFVRGLAIERGLRRAGFAGGYRMFGPRLDFPLARRCETYEEVPILREGVALQHPQLAQTSTLAVRLREYRPDLLLVDLFWAAVRWVLPLPECEAWLLVRSCPAAWLQGTPQLPFAQRQFRRILGIEPLTYPVLTEVIDPIVIANRDECRPAGALRESYEVPAGRPLTVVVQGGEPGEAAALAAAARAESAAGAGTAPRAAAEAGDGTKAGPATKLRAGARSISGAGSDLDAGSDSRGATSGAGPGAADGGFVTLDLHAENALFPAAEWLGGADRIFAGGGYNAFWEGRWLGYGERIRHLPFPRSIDDQAGRLRAFGDRVPAANGADVLAASIVRGG